MTQYVINIGNLPNDGTGDPLRTAFNDVNLNFNQVWATGLINSNIQIANNTILTTNTNGNLILNPNGIGNVIANAHVIPDQNRVRNLGSSTRRWDTAYVQYADIAGTLNVTGDASISGNLSVTGNIVYIGNLITDAKTIQLANTAGTANAANGSGITVGANDNIATFLYDSADNAWVTNVRFETGNLILTDDRIMDLYGPSITNADLISGSTSGLDIVPNGDANATVLYNTYGNLLLQTSNTGSNVKTFTFDYSGNLTLPTNTANINYANGVSILNGVGSYGNSNVATFLADFGSNTITTTGNITAGNIVPGTSNTYSLGNATNQWLDLYVSNATIYMNNVPISLTAGNVLTVNGDDVVTTNANGQANIGNLDITGTYVSIAAGANETIITISPNIEGQAYLQIPDDATANVANVRLHNDAGNIELGTGSGSYNWYFGNNGSLTIPGDINSNGTFAIDSGDDIRISGGDQLPDSAVSEGGDVTIFGGTGRIDNGISPGSGGDVRINAGNGGDGVSSGAGVGGYAEVQGGSGGAANVVNNIQAGEGGYVVIQGGQGGDNAGNIALSGLGGNVEIYGGTGSADDGNSTISGAPGHVNLYGGNWGFAGLATGNIYLNTYDGTNFKTLTYDSAGNVTMAPGGGLNFVGSNPGITSGLNQDFYIRASDDETDGWSIYNVVDDGAGNALTQTRLEYNQYSIRTNIQGATSHTWQFNDSGTLGLPGNIAGNYGGNLFISIGDQPGSDTFIDLRTISYVGDALISNLRIANPNVTVSTSSGAYNWTFDSTANLNLPPSGNIVGATANNNGYLNWLGNSSGDGGGYTTLRLVPDNTRESSDQYLIIDPTAPGHIHIRAGGTQDASSADLFLGGENTYFKVNAGANSEARISANSHSWVFGQDATLIVPGEGIIRSIQDTVILQSYDINGNTYSARLGTNGGLYFETTDYPNGWLSLTNNTGNANITAASGTAGAGGKNINITAGSADQSDYYTTPGGDVNITAGLGAFNDGGGGGHGGNVNITAGLSADPAGVAGNVTIGSGTNYWQFLNNGNLYVPGQINGDNNGNLIIDGAGYGNAYISLPASSFGGEQIAIVNDFSLGNGIRLQTNGGNLFFNDSADLSVTGNITGNYIFGNGSQLTGLPATYSDSNVTTLLAAYGSNTISTTGNITAGNLSVTGNVVGNITFTGGNILIDNATGAGGSDEGGELHFAAATANSTLSGPIAIDIYQSKMRFFETEGNTFGMYIDIANSMGVAGSSLGVPAIGYRDVPQISLSANVTANVTNAGKHFYSTTAGNITLTIPDNANVAFPTGATLTIVMNAAGNVVVAQGTGVSLYMAGSSSTGNRVVGAYGLASVMKVATDTWVISGTGVY